MTAVEWLIDQVEQFHCLLPVDMIEQAKAMEREQHGETWDDALAQVEKRTVWARAMCDFDEYWGKINIPISEDVGQPGLPEGGN